MIILLKKDAEQSQVENLLTLLRMKNITPSVSVGQMQTLIGCVGDVAHVDPGLIEALDVVESVQRIQEPYKAANRKFHPEPSVIDCSGVKVGGGNFGVIAGPCSVESEEQVVTIARAVKAAGADMLRGGAFKPRTSPYAFQGLGKKGIEFLLSAKKETGLPIVTELMSFETIDLFNDIDVIQIGARNMQNFDLLRELGHVNKPILLIAHDLAVVRNVCDGICVMESGRFVDEGPAERVFAAPGSAYTRRLLAAVPDVARALGG